MRLAALALAALLAGCALLEPGADRIVAVDGIIREAIAAARAPEPERKAALGRAQQSFERNPSGLNRLRLATLLAALPAPLRDEARAAALLEPLANAGAPGPERFAAFLAGELAERRRLAGEIERLARDAERAARERERLERERERLERERERLEREHETSERERERADKERDKREEALRQQLEALRAIERGILEREEKLRRRQR
jgi:DNA repair exonuclease SbcCD ATPase subunit